MGGFAVTATGDERQATPRNGDESLQEHERTAYGLPATLTPSKMSRFMSCPLSFRLSYLDRLPEPSTLEQVRGTIVHRALQLLFANGAAERDVERALEALDEAFHEPALREEVGALHLDEQATRRLQQEAGALVKSYFALEDPREVHPIGLELDVRVRVDEVELRGIIDRLDRLEDGTVVVVDYKTGRSPRPERSRSRLGGVHFYAFICEQLLGQRPREVRLMYLKDQVVVVESPTDQSMRGLRQRVMAIWEAIERACKSGDFRPNPSPLCRSCAFKDRCPAAPEP
jgi:putative RecB family exonuclease